MSAALEQPQERRDAFVDALRGFALLGIVVVNVPFLALSAEGFSPGSLATVADRAAAFTTIALAQAKFYLLFAFLFGYSLCFLLDRDDDAQRRRFRRRLLGLALLGAAHAVFAFVGDILVLYALIGTALLWWVRWSDRRLLAMVAALLLAWWLLLATLGGSLADGAAATAKATSTPALAALDRALGGGGFVEAALARLRAWPEAFGFIAVVNGMAVAAMFALGLVAGRRRAFSIAATSDRFWRRAAAWGWGVGLPPALWSAHWVWLDGVSPANDPHAMRAVLVGFAAAPLLSLAYVATLVRVHRGAPARLAAFEPAGRMSLTGYLGESIVLSLVFSAYGGALFGAVGAAAAMAIAVGTWAALDAFSRVWLLRFRHGPFESLLRRFTG